VAAPTGETALEKMFKKMRDKDGKLPAGLAISVEVDKDAGGKIIGFTLYAKADQILSVALGTAGAKDDRPAEPVVIF
jgi:hypothetical protein